MADVSPEALLAIFRRYGRPLDVAMPAPSADDQRHALGSLEASNGVVRVLQVRGYGDVIPNDYFVLEPHDAGHGDALAVSGPFFAAALEALARARPVRQS